MFSRIIRFSHTSTSCIALTFSLLATGLSARAQVGEHRNTLSIGGSAGWNMTTVGFMPKVPQSMQGGLTFGLTARYTSEKYFSSICAIEGEVNISHTGWRENILDIHDRPISLASDTTQAIAYQRKLTYVQIPILARMGWGRETKGLQFFVHAGPQLGILIGEATESNFDLQTPLHNKRVSNVVAQDTMAVERKVDYGIMAGAGLEWSHPAVGHFMLEGRYYYGLGDLFGNSKRDYFGRSNLGIITVKLTYLFDIMR
ncbi:MAG: PorT family protein [Prevotella sp.]|nr:PorT family protein [Prevotella sp.]